MESVTSNNECHTKTEQFSNSCEGKELRIKPKFCELCDEMAEAFCKTCRTFLCRDCESSHKRQKATRYHILTAYYPGQAIPEKEHRFLHCSLHEVEIDRFCNTCQEPACSECLEDRHQPRFHKLIPITNCLVPLRNACFELLKLYQIPFDKLKHNRKTIKQCGINQVKSLSSIEKELEVRRSKLLQMIMDAFTNEIQIVRDARSDAEFFCSNLSYVVDGAIKTYEGDVKPMMSTFMGDDIDEIIRGWQFLEEEKQSLESELARVEEIDQPLQFDEDIKYCDIVEETIKKYFKVLISADVQHKDADKLTIEIKRLVHVRQSVEDANIYIPKHICPERFCVQFASSDKSLVFMSYVDWTEHFSVFDNLPKARENDCRGTLTLSPTSHVLLSEGAIHLITDREIIKSQDYKHYDFTPDVIAYVNPHKFVTLCQNKAMIRYYSTASLECLGTFPLILEPNKKTRIREQLLVTGNGDLIIHLEYGNQNHLVRFARDGTMKTEIPVPQSLFDHENYDMLLMEGDQLIVVNLNGGIYKYNLNDNNIDGRVMARIYDDIESIYGIGGDDMNMIYISYCTQGGNSYIEKFKCQK